MSLISRSGLDPKSWLLALGTSLRVTIIGVVGFSLSWLILRVLAFPADGAITLAIYRGAAAVALPAWVVAEVGNLLWMPMVFWLYVFRKNKYEWTSALLIAVATILSMVLVDALKVSFMLPRPPEVLAEVVYRFGEPTTPAFPSGHTSRAFSLATVVWGRYVKWRIPFLALAVLTGVSMIIVGRHFPSDVIAGASVGIILGTFTANLARVRAGSEAVTER